MKRVHLIAVGGAIMHNLAIALKIKGHQVTGSDDAIYDPAKKNLEQAGLLPSVGWNINHIVPQIDVVILGMHAKPDNPELLKAKELGLSIMSFPEFVAQESVDKKRIVVAGSHGKTTTTAMIMYALNQLEKEFDYLVGSSLDGFELSVKLSDAPLIIIEGDEYLSSPIDRRSKFLWYKPHVSIITGIAYDHINVFPTFDGYVDTFRQYICTHVPDGKYFWFKKDEHLQQLASATHVNNEWYDTPDFEVTDTGSTVYHNGIGYPVAVVGKHNLENLRVAQLVCADLGVEADTFYKNMATFTGAGRRMEKIVDRPNQVVYRDFAHSPSKLKATTEAIKETYAGELVAVFEMHTFSTLNKDFMPLYKDTMQKADKAYVFYDSAVFEHKNMELVDTSYVASCFGNVEVINAVKKLESVVNKAYEQGANVLLMSSGKFEGAKFCFEK